MRAPALIPTLLIFLSVPVNAESQSCKPDHSPAVQPGYTCRTSTGGEWRLVKRDSDGTESWRDLKTRILWGDRMEKRVRRLDAGKLCAKSAIAGGKKSSLLPTLEDYRTAEANGIRQALPHFAGHFYWIDSKIPGAANVGHVFNGNLGKEELIIYRSINFENVRCIQR